MRRPAVLSFLGLAVAAILALAVQAAGDERDLAFTIGVVPERVAVILDPGETACQRPVTVEEEFAAVRFKVGSFGRPGDQLGLTVRGRGETLAFGRLGGGYHGDSDQVVKLDRPVAEGPRVAICLRNAGSGRLAFYGQADATRAGMSVFANGVRGRSDLSLVFLREEPRSALALVPEMFRRASLFRFGWVGPWTFWLLLVLVAAGIPALIAAALRSAAAEEEDQTVGSPSR